MKYRIFVCSECKSAHQSFSHKCKSVTMSNWSLAEVEQLKAPHGGNPANTATIFAKLPKDSDAYPTGCGPNEVKEFVNLAYNENKWAAPDATQCVAAPMATKAKSACEVPAASIDPFGFGAFEQAPPPVIKASSEPRSLATGFDLLDVSLDVPSQVKDEWADASFISTATLFSALAFDDPATAPGRPAGTNGGATDGTFGAFADAFGGPEDAFGEFESVSNGGSPGPAQTACASANRTVSPSSIVQGPLAACDTKSDVNPKKGSDLFARFLETDLMAAPSVPAALLPPSLPPTKAATALPMATMAPPRAAAPLAAPLMPPMAINPRVPLGHDFVDLAAIRKPIFMHGGPSMGSAVPPQRAMPPGMRL